MFREIYDCIVIEHDTQLLLLAAIICLFASYTTMSLLLRARDTVEGGRRWWTFQTAFAAGCGIWATHFVAMLAYDPGMRVAYDLALTVISVCLAILITGVGFAVATYFANRFAQVVAGTTVGLGIASMHYVGMMAVRVPGVVSYDRPYLLLAVVLAVVFSTAALFLLRAQKRSKLLWATLCFVIAICALHFTAMTAVSITFDPTVATPVYAVSEMTLVVGVAVAASILLTLVLSNALVDRHMAAQLSQEVVLLRQLANAPIDGIAILDRNGRMVTANDSFLALTGRRLDVLRGLSFLRCFRNVDMDFDWQSPATRSCAFPKAVAIHASGDEKIVDIYLRNDSMLSERCTVAIVRDPSQYENSA